MGDWLLAADIGTSGTRVTVFDALGAVMGTASVFYDSAMPHPNWHEQDPRLWWQGMLDCVAQIRGQGVDLQQVAAIGVDGTSWAGLPVNRAGEALCPAMTWIDRRADKQARAMAESPWAEELRRTSGNPLDSAYITPKMLWLKENRPELFAETHCFLQSNAYIVHHLTGAFSQDRSQGYGFHFYDVARGEYRTDLMEKLGLDARMTAPLFDSGEIVGELLPAVAREMGLKPYVPVVAGGLDAACCSLGAGVLDAGSTQEQGGQAGGMSLCMDHPVYHPKLILGAHVAPGRWLLQGGSVGGGGALRWLQQMLGGSFDELDREAEAVSPGADGLIFLPYMAGERSPIWDSDARGVFFGLSYDKTRGHLVRAVMEGVAFSLRHNLETAGEAGVEAQILRPVGGAASSRLWTQIKADVTGKVMQVPPSKQATALGAALLAGAAVGVYRDLHDAVEKTVHIQRVHEPDPARHAQYEELYQIYLHLYPALKEQYGALGRAARKNG